MNYREKQRLDAYQKLCKLATKRGDCVVGEYKNNKSKIDMICSKGHKFSITPDSYKRGSSCAKCAGKCSEQAKESFYTLVRNNNDKIVGEYNKTTTKIDMICSKGHKFSISPKNYKHGYGCAKCAGLCPEQAKETFYDLARNNNDDVIGEYRNNRTKIDMICSKGHKFVIKPNDYKRGSSCAKCARLCPEQAKETFYVLARNNNDDVIGEYRNNRTKIDMICSKGHKFSIIPNAYKNGVGCAKCAGHTQQQAYINLIIDNNIPMAIKFGIAKDSKIRIKRQQSKTSLTLQQIGVWYFDAVEDCKASELHIKQNFDCGVLSERELPDGHTETLGTEHINAIISIYEKFGGIKQTEEN